MKAADAQKAIDEFSFDQCKALAGVAYANLSGGMGIEEAIGHFETGLGRLSVLAARLSDSITRKLD